MQSSLRTPAGDSSTTPGVQSGQGHAELARSAIREGAQKLVLAMVDWVSHDIGSGIVLLPNIDYHLHAGFAAIDSCDMLSSACNMCWHLPKLGRVNCVLCMVQSAVTVIPACQTILCMAVGPYDYVSCCYVLCPGDQQIGFCPRKFI